FAATPVISTLSLHDALPISRELGQADLVYRGSFTFENAGTTCSAGPRDFAYVQGVIAFNPARGSLFVVGHDHCQHVAEFEVPEAGGVARLLRSEEHTSELQSREKLVCRLLLEKKKN